MIGKSLMNDLLKKIVKNEFFYFYVASLIGLVVIMIVCIGVFLFPKHLALNSIKSKLSYYQQQASTVEQDIVKLQEKIEKNQLLSKKIKRMTFKDDPYPLLFEIFMAPIKTYNVKLSRFTYSSKKSSAGSASVKTYFVKFDIKGDYSNVGAYFDNIESFGLPITYQKILIHNSTTNDSDIVVKLQLNINLFESK